MEPTADPTGSPTNTPSDSPSQAPTSSPTQSPTRIPTAEDEYDNYIEMKYGITGLDTSELQFIAENAVRFGLNLSDIIEAGLDDDELIQFKDIEVNVTELNGEDTKHSMTVLDLITDQNMLNVTSFTNCTVAFCTYIIGKGTRSFNESAFEQFVSSELQQYFSVNVNAAGTVSDIGFTVLQRSESALSFEVMPTATEETKEDVYWILMSISGMFCFAGFVALCYEKGAIPILKRKVDTSKWLSFFALGLQFWDFASDISLCYELWFLDNLYRERVLFVCAVGSSAFLVIPYLANLRIAARVKQYVVQNEAASTWFVTRCFLKDTFCNDQCVLF